MSIWNDRMLREWGVYYGITPFCSECINPASIDLRWSGRWKRADVGGWTDIYDTDTLVLKPGAFYLLDTLEYIRMPNNAVGKLFLKSSAGRMGIEHLHAGYVDPDFEGTLSLELEIRVPWPVTISKRQRLVQLTLETMTEVPVISYTKTGRYSGQNVPTESKGLQK